MKYFIVFIGALMTGRLCVYILSKFWNFNLKVLNTYPIIDLSMVLIYCGFFYFYGFNLFSFFYSFLFASLLIVSFIDFKHYLIPNKIVLIIFISGLFFHLTSYSFNIYNACLSFLGAGLFFLSLQILSKGGLGGGDIKLVAVLGLWFGFPNIALIIFLSAFLGSLVGIILILMKFINKDQALAFGPFLAVATLIVFLAGDKIWMFYLRAF